MFEGIKARDSSLLEAKVLSQYFEATRTSQLKDVWGQILKRLIAENKLKLKMEPLEHSVLVAFHKELRVTYLNYQIIRQIYYEAIIKTTYFFYMLSKIDQDNDILSSAPDKQLLKELLEFYPSYPHIVKRSWISRKVPALG